MDFFDLILGIVALILTYLAYKYRSKLSDAEDRIEALKEALDTIEQAIKDEKITKEELKEIVEKLKKAVKPE